MSPSDEDWMRPCDVKPATQDLEVVLKRINELTDLGVQRIERSWSGLRTFAPDRLPVAGFDPIVPNFYWLVGQGGYGIQTSAAVAQLVCADLLGRSSRFDPQLDEVFTSLRPERLAVQ
jgi:D-arginine dehydrogenase